MTTLHTWLAIYAVVGVIYLWWDPVCFVLAFRTVGPNPVTLAYVFLAMIIIWPLLRPVLYLIYFIGWVQRQFKAKKENSK